MKQEITNTSTLVQHWLFVKDEKCFYVELHPGGSTGYSSSDYTVHVFFSFDEAAKIFKSITGRVLEKIEEDEDN